MLLHFQPWRIERRIQTWSCLSWDWSTWRTTKKLQPHMKTSESHNMASNNRRLKVYKITEAVRILEERVRYILHQQVNMRKVCVRWVSYLLNADRKRISQQCLDRFKDSTDFVRWFVSGWDYGQPLYSRNEIAIKAVGGSRWLWIKKMRSRWHIPEQARRKIREKRPGLQKRKSFFISTMHLPTKVL